MEIKRYKIIWGYEELQETKSTDCRNCEIVVKYSDIKHLLGQPKIDNLIKVCYKFIQYIKEPDPRSKVYWEMEDGEQGHIISAEDVDVFKKIIDKAKEEE